MSNQGWSNDLRCLGHDHIIDCHPANPILRHSDFLIELCVLYRNIVVLKQFQGHEHRFVCQLHEIFSFDFSFAFLKLTGFAYLQIDRQFLASNLLLRHLCKINVEQTFFYILWKCSNVRFIKPLAQWSIETWIRDYIDYNVWDEITYPFPNLHHWSLEMEK